jgi:iron-sulfur cluster repair protein YtfE (RIC family)
MTTLTEEGPVMIRAFVNHEHGELEAGIDRIHELACDLRSLPASEMSAQIRGILGWVEKTLQPHLAWEETWLFPQIDRRAATPWATRYARFDHRQIARQAARLGTDRTHLDHGPSSHACTELRCDLFSLEALLRAHVEREERLLLPLLDADHERWSAEWRD